MNATLASSDEQNSYAASAVATSSSSTLRAARTALRDSLRQAYREDTDLTISQHDVICALGAVIGELGLRHQEK